MKVIEMGQRLLCLTVGLVSLLALSACGSGGNGGGGTTSVAAPVQGVFVDSPVQGLGYSTTPSGLSGLTDVNGQYNYNPGDTVTFSLFGRAIGTAVPSAPVVTALSVFNATSVADPRVLNLSQLLLTLGGIPVGSNPIPLPETPPAGFPATLDFTDPAFDSSFPNLTLVQEATATTHLQGNFSTLSVTLAGSGATGASVTSNPAGINCGATCSADFSNGTAVTLTVTGAGFTGWSGGCTGTGACVVTLNATTSVTATFAAVPVNANMTVTTAGNGTGTVTSSPAGINCGVTCAAQFIQGTVDLTAIAANGSTFAGWSSGTGNASCLGTGICSIPLTVDSTVTATFTLNAVPVSVTANIASGNGGNGTVQCSANGIPGPCGSYPVGTTMVLTATPNVVSNFTGWSGAGCSGTGTCNFTLTANTTVTANFNRPTLTVQVTGTGSVSSTPTGINSCTTNCTAPFDKGTVTLTASGAGFTGWSSGCTGTGNCVVTLSQNTTVTATFTPPVIIPPMTIPRVAHTATMLQNGQVLITGGFSSSIFPSSAVNTAELYNPTTNTFTALTSTMRSTRSNHTATLLLNGQVLLTGGQIDTNNGNGNNSAELYNPATQTFTAIPATMTVPRGGHAATRLPNGQVLLAGGFNMGFTDLPIAHNTAELYDPTTQTFTAIAATLTSARSDNPTATLLPNGQVLLTGGKGQVSYNNTAELYNPTTQTFAAIAATMTSVRASHTATLLPSGLVLVTGGLTIFSASNPSSSVILNSVELYDPTAQTFTAATATMTVPRAGHAETLLANGSVLLTGGVNVGSNNFVALNTAEAYRP